MVAATQTISCINCDEQHVALDDDVNEQYENHGGWLCSAECKEEYNFIMFKHVMESED